MRRLTALITTAALASAATLVGTLPAHAAGGPALPSADPFYQYANSMQGKAGTPLASIKPGTVLASRSVDLGLTTKTSPLPAGALPAPLPALPTTAEQLLYRTADEQGKPTVTVTTVVEPATGAVSPKIIAYLSFYDSLAGKCDPSYTLQGGDPGSNNSQLTEIEQALVQAYAADAVVTVPDFEGEGLHWTAGHEAGYGTLDAIRATESYLKAPAKTTMVGLTGYSGGSIAADWASELAPAYAPELNIVGVAEGGIPVDFAHNLTYINGSAVWSGIMPAVLVALSRAFGIDLPTYLSPYGMKLAKIVQDQCIGEFEGMYPGLTIQKLLKPQYQDFLKVPTFAAVVNKELMGTEPGHPKGPLFMAVGNDPKNAQGQGDDIMVTKDVQALAHEYCTQGVPVNFTVYSNSTHTQAALQFEPDAIKFLQARFAETPFMAQSCAAIGTGNALTPLPTNGGASSTAPPSGTPSATSNPVAATTTASTGGGDLAFTGIDPEVALVALALVAGGVGALGLRRRTRRN